MDDRWERLYFSRGFRRVAGVDEAGRGPLAGPVVAGAVILKPGRWPERLDDSKRLSGKQRLSLFRELRQTVAAWSVGFATPAEIDRWNIRMASFMAMERALARLRLRPEAALVDGFFIPGLVLPQEGIIDGDAQVPSIAAASIFAKVVRDRLMTTYARQFPGYGFEKHKGYSTKEHRLALQELGPSPIHRRSFAPVRAALQAEHESLDRAGRRVATQREAYQREAAAAGVGSLAKDDEEISLHSSPSEKGRRAERWAAASLRAAGYRILARNLKRRNAEADVVALESEQLVILEIRFRSSGQGGSPIETIDQRKRARLLRLADRCWLELEQRHPALATAVRGVRFDVVEVFPGPEGLRMRLWQDAF